MMAGQFAKNEPYDKIVKNILTAEQEGSEMFYVQYRNAPEEAATAVARFFLGTQLQCARCHDHPSKVDAEGFLRHGRVFRAACRRR